MDYPRHLRQAALIGLAAGALAMPPAAVAQARDAVAPLPFAGRALVALSDADMLASAYVDGFLGPREGEDMLSVIPLGGHPRDLKASQVPVSNSVAGPPAAVAVTPDGRYAIAVEAFTPRPNDNRTDQRFTDLKNGRALTVVDISDPSKPQVVQRITGLERPDSVSISADGTLVAVALNPNGSGTKTPLAIYRFANGRLTEASATAVIPGWYAGDALSHAEFHPRDNLIALVNQSRDELSFFHVEMRAGVPTRVRASGPGRLRQDRHLTRSNTGCPAGLVRNPKATQ